MARREGTESPTVKRACESPAIPEQVMEEVCDREKLKQALQRVKSNKGSPGIEGMTVGELPGELKQHWPAIRVVKQRRSSWRLANSPALSTTFPNAYFDSLGLPRLLAG